MRPARLSRSAFVVAIATFLLVGLAAPVVALGGSTTAGSVQDTSPVQSTAGQTTAAVTGPESLSAAQQEFDRTAFVITVYENGSARWTFRFERTLANETERQDFETFAEEFNTQETRLYTDFVNRSERLVAAGTNATGREMAAEDFRREARVGPLGNEGIVEMSFRWRAFAPVQNGQVVVGDVFEGGLYIRADQRLVFVHGPGLVFEEASPSPDSISAESLAGSDSVTWRGERTFADGRPRVVLAPPAPETATPTVTPDGGSGGPTDTVTTPGGGGDGLGLLPLVALLVVLVLGVGAAVAYRSGMVGGDDGGAASAGGGGGTGGPDGGPDGGAGGSAEGAAGAAGAAASSDDADTEPEPIADEELLSDEERVMRLLDERGGRMKQVNIVEETDWSKSKVSMLLSEMEDEGKLSKLRVGRENIISKKGMEPEAARSPFEDETGDGEN